MFTISSALKNIRRHIRKSALYFLICVIAVLTLQIYMAGIDRTEKQLQQLPDALPISANVASLDGVKFDGLQIKENTVDGLQKSPHVRDLYITASLVAGIGEYTDELYGKHAIWSVVGVNTLAALEGLDPDTVTWLPGYNSDWLNGNEVVCLADSFFMEVQGLSLGDSVPLDLYYYKYGDRGAMSREPLELTETLIVGITDLRIVKNSPNIVIPLESTRSIFHNNNVTFYASSASFYVRDALKLNEFKGEMTTLGLNKVSPSSEVAIMVMSNQGTSLVVNDATFISSATRLRESLSLLRGFLPLLIALLAAIGYFVAYLMIQTRSEEYAVLRLLGLGKRKCMGLYFAEISALTLCGSLLGVIMSVALGIGGFNTGFWVFILFSLCFILGSIIALWRLGRTNVMLALARAE